MSGCYVSPDPELELLTRARWLLYFDVRLAYCTTISRGKYAETWVYEMPNSFVGGMQSCFDFPITDGRIADTLPSIVVFLVTCPKEVHLRCYTIPF